MFPLKDDIPTRRFPVLTVAIILVNIAMFFGFQGAFFGTDAMFNERVVEYGAIPYELTNPGEQCGPTQGGALACEGQEGVTGEAPDQPSTWLTILTSMFMHGGLLHIAGNMLFLWVFGNNIEDSMGRARFLLFYLGGGVAALAAQTAFSPDAAVPTIGASGAVAAVLGGYALIYPRARVVTLVFIVIFFTIIQLPALLVLGLWFLLQAFYGVSEVVQPVGGEGGGVAYFAHIGGFVFGLVLIKLFATNIDEDYRRPQRTAVY